MDDQDVQTAAKTLAVAALDPHTDLNKLMDYLIVVMGIAQTTLSAIEEQHRNEYTRPTN